MKPIKFKEQNITYAENQPEYIPLPALKLKGKEGEVVSCWKLSFLERLRVVMTGKFFLQVLTLNKPAQQLSLSVRNPLKTFFLPGPI